MEGEVKLEGQGGRREENPPRLVRHGSFLGSNSPRTMCVIGTPTPSQSKIEVQLLTPQNLTTNTLLLTRSFTENINS